jgi:DNA-binding NarL/FixJ family response regulator
MVALKSRHYALSSSVAPAPAKPLRTGAGAALVDSPSPRMGRTSEAGPQSRPAARTCIRVLVAEALPLLRRGLEAALNEDPRIEIVGIFEDPRAAVEAARTCRPRVVLMGSQLQHVDAIQGTRRIKAELPDVDVIVIGTSEEESVVFSAIEAGAVGYVLQDITAEDLCEAICGVCDGMTMVHPRVVRQMVDRLALLSQKVGAGAAAGLTSRELDVLLAMAAGRTDKEIAREFSLTESTVKSHIRTVFQKTGAANRVQAVALAMRVGLIR